MRGKAHHLNSELPELGVVAVLHCERMRASFAEVHLWQIFRTVVAGYRLGALIDGASQLLWRRSTIRSVVPAFTAHSVIRMAVHLATPAAMQQASSWQAERRQSAFAHDAKRSLDSEVLVGAARVVAGRQDEAARCAAATTRANHCGHGWRGHQAINTHLWKQHVSCRHVPCSDVQIGCCAGVTVLLTHRHRTPFAAANLMMVWMAGLLK